MMVTDHTNVQDQLANLAESNDLAISDTLKTEHQILHDQLSSLEGPAFDSAYINSQILAHQEAQQIFQTQIDKGQHPQLVELPPSHCLILICILKEFWSLGKN